MNCYRLLAYSFHGAFIGVTLAGWWVYRPAAILIPLVGMSWEINNNNCLLTQVETKLFGKPLIPGRISKWGRMVLWVDMLSFAVHACSHAPRPPPHACHHACHHVRVP